MSKLTRDDVVRLAYLARLQLSDDEIEKYVKELSEILSFVEELNNVETEGLEPTSQVTGLVNVSREDVEQHSVNQKELLKNVPTTEGDHIKVKRMIA